MDRPSLIAVLTGKTPEATRRRNERSKRWAREDALATPESRRAAWRSLVLADHGFVRMVYLNRHRVSEELWRSAQPAPRDVARAAAAGIRTVITLRNGYDFGSWPLEVEACARHGLDLVRLPLFSRNPPTVAMLEEAEATFARIAWPALMHCKSGADRAGLGAALYLLIRKGRPAAEALAQLRLAYGHVRWGRTGILDAFVEAYRDEGEAEGLSFMEWARTRYDREALMEGFHSRRWADLLVDRVLRRE